MPKCSQEHNKEKGDISVIFSLLLQIDEDLTARICMADVKFSFQCPGRMYSPAWVAPEGRHQLYKDKSRLTAKATQDKGEVMDAGNDTLPQTLMYFGSDLLFRYSEI